MPYIKKELRANLTTEISELAESIVENAGDVTATAGLLNYAFTQLTLEVMKKLENKHGTSLRRYWFIALMTGVFTNVKDEFYRRFAAPYEDEMIEQNGDVYGPGYCSDKRKLHSGWE